MTTPSDTPRTGAIIELIALAVNQSDRARFLALCMEAERGIAELERDLAAVRAQLAERENWDRLRGEEARRLTNEIAEARRTRDVVLSANVNITMERDQIREQLAERDAEIARQPALITSQGIRLMEADK